MSSLTTQEKLDLPLHKLMEITSQDANTETKHESSSSNNNNNNNNSSSSSYGKSEYNNGNRRGGRRGGRGGGYSRGRGGQQHQQHQQQRPVLRNYDSADKGRVLKISAESKPKTVAGAISHISRQGECPAMLATGAASVNQAIKALAIARSYLEKDDIDINCYPTAQKDTRNGILFTLTKTARRQAPAEVEVQEMKVSASSNPGIVAGAVAIKLREGQRVAVTAMGADSVLHGVQAISMGRKYVEENGLDIAFRPEFTKVQLDDGEDRSAIKFMVISQQI